MPFDLWSRSSQWCRSVIEVNRSFNDFEFSRLSMNNICNFYRVFDTSPHLSSSLFLYMHSIPITWKMEFRPSLLGDWRRLWTPPFFNIYFWRSVCTFTLRLVEECIFIVFRWITTQLISLVGEMVRAFDWWLGGCVMGSLLGVSFKFFFSKVLLKRQAVVSGTSGEA